MGSWRGQRIPLDSCLCEAESRMTLSLPYYTGFSALSLTYIPPVSERVICGILWLTYRV